MDPDTICYNDTAMDPNLTIRKILKYFSLSKSLNPKTKILLFAFLVWGGMRNLG